tara:strand:+ start:1102 stop:2172 length:1071 start_codon:yes stop_codon:yes gene_type:complete
MNGLRSSKVMIATFSRHARSLLHSFGKIDWFLFANELKRFSHNNHRIGFSVPNAKPYNIVMPSTRIRCYDIIRFFSKYNVLAELYKEGYQYSILIFNKCFDDEHIALAEELKDKGTVIVFDVNVDYINFKKGEKDLVQNVVKMLDLSDMVITASEYLHKVYQEYNLNTVVIEESVSKDFFRVRKQHEDKDTVFLMYVGYAEKAQELYLIEDVLKRLYVEYGVRLLFICERDPKLKIIPYDYKKYDHKVLPFLLLEGDIKIAPRDLSEKRKLGHTFTKVAYPMAMGLPAVASPVESYLDRGVLICRDGSSWYKQLKRLITSPEERTAIGYEGRRIVEEQLSIDTIGKMYLELFQKYL